jgi:ribosomal protein S18 acetylase RimI-like enzyme
MTTVKARHDMTPEEVDALEDRLYRHNAAAIGRDDARGIGFVIESDDGETLAAAAGYTWAATSELKQLWVDARHRGRGLGRALLDAYSAEALRRGVKRIWVQSHDFQAPRFYEAAGFIRMAEFEGWPDGHVNVVLCRVLSTS